MATIKAWREDNRYYLITTGEKKPTKIDKRTYDFLKEGQLKKVLNKNVKVRSHRRMAQRR
jgi:hypothetical protein